MLHIILGILKLIGILLAVILLLVLGTILAVLFAPLRYKGQLRKTPECMDAEVRVSWFLHFLSFFCRIDMEEKKPHWEIRICGIQLSAILSFWKRCKNLLTRSQKAKKAVKGRREDEWEEDIPSKDIPSKDIPSKDYPSKEYQEEDYPEEGQAEADLEEESLTEESLTEESLTEESSTKESLTREVQAEARSEENSPKQSFFQRIHEKIANLRQRILQFRDKIIALWRKLCGMGQSMLQTAERIQNIPDQINGILAMLEKYEAKAVAGEVLDEVFMLLRHYVPRKLSGYLHFGTGDPAVTGQLTGVLYMILPVRAAEFRLEPEFTEAVFETEMVFSGRVRACHLAGAAWRLFRNKKLKRLIAKIKKIRK